VNNGKFFFDVLIVGAGPAGSSAAAAAAKAGAHVLMIEKRRQIGKPVQCAEFIPRLLKHKVKIPPEAIAQKIQEMITFMPNGEIIRKRAPGFILNRAKFDQALAKQASEAGVKILTGTKAVHKTRKKITVLGPLGEDQIEASVVIGADGPNSTVGSWIGQKNRKFISAIQHTVVLKKSVEETEIYFGKEYPGGYAWLFPKGEMANVGVGIQRELGGIAKLALKSFKEKIAHRIGKIVDVTAGQIPVGGPLLSIDEKDRIILVGDAAGHTHAITGGGIPQAVICGAMAGKAAAAAANGDKRTFQNYFHQWKSAYGPMMEKAAIKREKMEAGWHKENFMELMKSCWVACKEYYYNDA
jgi:digeranylgeranylglycerophospholipid reductase